MRRFVTVILGAICVSVLLFGSVHAAEWEFHDYQRSFPYPDRLTVYGTIDCVIQEPALYQGWLEYCETAGGCVPNWCNDLVAVFEWPDPPEGCGNVDYWKAAAVGGVPGDWELDPLGDWIDMLPAEGIELPSIGDSTGLTRDIYLVVDLVEYLIHYPVPVRSTYHVSNGVSSDLPGYLIGTTPIEFTPSYTDPFYTLPFTGDLQFDGRITFRPGGPSANDETNWSSIKALFR